MEEHEQEQAQVQLPEPQAKGRNVVIGLAVTVSRAGTTAGRRMLWPVRVAEGLPFVRGRVQDLAATGREAELGSRRRLEGVAESVLAAPEAGRTLDSVLAGPLPESISRSMVEHQVVERVARETLDERQTARIVESVLASPEFEAALHRVASSPALRDALAQQSVGFADQLTDALRRRAAHADSRFERHPRAWARRAARVEPVPFGGLVSRGLAFALDLVLVTLIFVVASALVGLASSLVGGFHPQWLVVAIAGVSALLLHVAYFAGFWSLAGQTPGMRLLGVRVVGPDGSPPGFGRALVRLIGLYLAIIPLFLGFAPALVDERRRALQDLLANTVVVYAVDAPLRLADDAPTASR